MPPSSFFFTEHKTDSKNPLYGFLRTGDLLFYQNFKA